MKPRVLIDNLSFHLKAKVRSLSFRPYVKKETIAGVTFDFVVGDAESSIWESPTSEDKELSFVATMLSPGDTVFDCGAHHGKTALFFSKIIGSRGSVVAFEPRPKNTKIIQQNIDCNRANNITVVRCAIGERRSVLSLRDRSNGSLTWKKWQHGISVEVITLDEYAKQNSLWPTFIKIDVEGFEGQVFKGAREILSKCPKLAIEIHPQALGRYGDSVDSLLNLLDLSRYNCWSLEESGDPVPLKKINASLPRLHLFAVPR